MRCILLVTLIFILVKSYGQKKVTVSFKNTVKASSDTFILERQIDGSSYVFDTSIIRNNISAHVVNFYSQETNLCRLRITSAKGYCQFILDKDLIIELNLDSMWTSKVTGSPTTNQWNLYNNNIIKPIKTQIILLSNKMNNLKFDTDSLKINQLKYQQSILIQKLQLSAEKYIAVNKTSYVSLYLLNWGFDDIKIKSKLKLFYGLSKTLKSNSLGIYLRKKIEKEITSKNYKELSIVMFKDLNRKEFNYEKYLGKFTLIDFWGTWCGPCLLTIPSLRGLHNLYHNKLNIVSIAIEYNIDTATINSSIKKHHLEWDSYVLKMDNDAFNFKNLLNITNFPSFILVDFKGTVIRKEFGLDGLKKVKNEIEKLLKNKN